MKWTKKAAAMLLAVLIMAAPVSAAAANYEIYPDANEVTYAEAMDVLVGIGVIEGMDGELNPKDNFTREQAAKMIAYMLLGESGAEALSTVSSRFKDVEPTRWSAGCIEYLAVRGIINGVGDDLFDPTGNVTGYQFVKMLLCAIGYGVNNEFVGSTWAVKVATYASKTGAFTGSGASSGSVPATREEAMLYAFNLLTGAAMVKYASGSYYTVSAGDGVLTREDDDFYSYTLGYSTFGLYSETEKDDGEYYRYWVMDDEIVSDSYEIEVEEEAVQTETMEGEFSLSELYEELDEEEYEVALWLVDGEDQTDELDDTTLHDDNDEQIGSEENITVVYVYEDEEEVELYTYNYYLAQVTDWDEEEVELCLYLTDDDGEDGYEYTFTDEDDADDFDEGDYVLVTCDREEDEVCSILEADVFSGTVTYYGSTYLEIYGYYFELSEQLQFNEAAAGDDYYSTYLFYCNDAEYIVGIELAYYVAPPETETESETGTETETETETETVI